MSAHTSLCEIFERLEGGFSIWSLLRFLVSATLSDLLGRWGNRTTFSMIIDKEYTSGLFTGFILK